MLKLCEKNRSVNIRLTYIIVTLPIIWNLLSFPFFAYSLFNSSYLACIFHPLTFSLTFPIFSLFNYRNIAEPSLTKDYSSLDKGDTIKAIAVSPYYLYRLEARERGSNGGIFVAPQNYRLVTVYCRKLVEWAERRVDLVCCCAADNSYYLDSR